MLPPATSVNAFHAGFGDAVQPEQAAVPGPERARGVAQGVPDDAARSGGARVHGRELEGPRQVFRLALGPTTRPGGLPREAQPTSVIQIGLSRRPRLMILRALATRGQRVAGWSAYGMHGGRVEEVCGAGAGRGRR